MAAGDLDQICDDIASTLSAATGFVHTQSLDELTEGYPDVPMLQVYPESGETDVASENDRTTFGAVRRQAEYVFTVDAPARARSNMGQDMKAAIDAYKALETVLQAQTAKPYFGNAAIKAFHWTWQRATFQPEGSDRSYVGVRLQISVRIF